MGKKTFVVSVAAVLLIATLLTGCFEQQTMEKQPQTTVMPLDTVALTLDDIPEGYEKQGEEHIQEPYTVEEGKLLAGWWMLEKYEVRFLKNDYQFILHAIARLPTVEKAHEAFNEIKTAELEYKFTEMQPPDIGGECYLGENTSIISNHEVTLYFLCFRTYDLIVVVLTSDSSDEDTVSYGRIVERNVENAVLKENQP
ncbi:MAG TPA: hypothetical protein EYP23_05375 [Thermoplasmata archaeon]|nr:hypothetical protein [Thermoplasmata archaeon]